MLLTICLGCSICLLAEGGTLRLVGWAHAARTDAVRTLVWARAGHALCAGHADGVSARWTRARHQLVQPTLTLLYILLCVPQCITVWRVEAGRRGAGVRTTLSARLHSHEAALHALTLVADDMLLLACCMDGVLKLWRMQGATITLFVLFLQPVSVAAVVSTYL